MAAPPGGADAVAATPPPDDGGLTHDWSTLSGDVLCACFLRTLSRFFSLFPYIQQTLVASLVSGNSECEADLGQKSAKSANKLLLR